MLIRSFQDSDTTAAVQLWNRCGLTRSWNNPQLDIQRKLKAQPEGFLVGLIDNEIVASVMIGYDGHRGWINYLAIDPAHQRKGLGCELMAKAEQHLLSVGCPKINLQIRLDNAEAIEFYESIGFTQDKVVSYGKRLIPDEMYNNS